MTNHERSGPGEASPPTAWVATDASLVGREPELRFFARILADSGPHRGLWLHGPGGVGKTVLLRELLRRCALSGRRVVLLDADPVSATPAALEREIRTRLGIDPSSDWIGQQGPRGAVIAIDDAHRLGALHAWLFDDLVPTLPTDTVLLLAGRAGPQAPIRARLVSTTGIRTMGLRNFSLEESRTLLTRLEVPARFHRAIHTATHGHPMALALFGEVSAGTALDPGNVDSLSLGEYPEVVEGLVDLFLRDVQIAPPARSALYLSAIARRTTEDLLRAVLGLDEGQGFRTFEWLRGRSFVRVVSGGLVLHPLVRDALRADLRWRDATRYADLISRLVEYLAEHAAEATGRRQLELAFDIGYVFNSSGVAPADAAEGFYRPAPTPAEASDWQYIEALTAQHEGPESLALLRAWRDHRPDVHVTRDADGLTGFIFMLRLDRSGDGPPVADPVTEAVSRALHRLGVGPSEPVLLCRFWMTRDGYKDLTAHSAPLNMRFRAAAMATPGIAVAAYVVDGSPHWDELVARTPIERLPVDCEVGGHRYGVLYDEFRGQTIAEFARKHLPPMLGITPPPTRPPSVVALPRAEFARWVGDAVDHLDRPEQLVGNPLVRSRLVEAEVGRVADPSRRTQGLVAALRRELDSSGLSRPLQGPDLDWLTTALWQKELGEGEVADNAATAPTPEERPVGSSREQFDTSVLRALRAIDRPHLLVESPLARARFVTARTGRDADLATRAEALGEILRAQMEVFAHSPRDRDYHRVLRITYLGPAAKQSAAAGQLGMSLSTFQRRLREARARMTDALWLLEHPESRA